MNALAMLTRGYICPVADSDEEVVIGEGPKIIDVDELTPVITRGKQDPEDDHECP
jgi:hypothetical protein